MDDEVKGVRRGSGLSGRAETIEQLVTERVSACELLGTKEYCFAGKQVRARRSIRSTLMSPKILFPAPRAANGSQKNITAPPRRLPCPHLLDPPRLRLQVGSA